MGGYDFTLCSEVSNQLDDSISDSICTIGDRCKRRNEKGTFDKTSTKAESKGTLVADCRGAVLKLDRARRTLEISEDNVVCEVLAGTQDVKKCLKTKVI